MENDDTAMSVRLPQDRQDAEDYTDAVDIMERVGRGEERVYSSEEVRADLGLSN
jgi:predicted DNA-binding protein